MIRSLEDHREIIVSGSLRRAILLVAGPATLSMLLQATFNIVDMIWVGRLGPPALAALSTGGFLIWSILAISDMIDVGIASVTARYVGAGRFEEARYVAGQGLILSLVLSFCVAILGLMGSDKVFGIMETDPQVTVLGLSYLRIIYLGLPTVFLFFATNAIFRGFGDTATPLRILLVSAVGNLILDPFLIFGLGPFPRLEVEGAALATVICRGLGIAVAIAILKHRSMISFRLPHRRTAGKIEDDGEPGHRKTGDGFRLRLSGRMLDPGLFLRIIRIGAPITLGGVLFCGVYILLTRITTDFGTEAVAALGIGHRGESISYMSAVGFSMAAGTIVGQNLGAGRPDRAAQGAWLSLFYLSAITVACGLLFALVPAGIVGVFNRDPLVLKAGSDYLLILSFSQLFMGAEIVMEGAFSGAGDTVPPMAVAVPFSIARIPLAYWLAYDLGLGINGVWWSISLTSVIKGILISLWFLRGRWKEKSI